MSSTLVWCYRFGKRSGKPPNSQPNILRPILNRRRRRSRRLHRRSRPYGFGISGKLVATNWAKILNQKLREYTIRVVYMLTRHFSSFGSEFELLFANRAVRLYLGLVDFDRGHRLDRRLRSRRVLVPRDHAVQFALRQSLQKPIEPGPQQKI